MATFFHPGFEQDLEGFLLAGQFDGSLEVPQRQAMTDQGSRIESPRGQECEGSDGYDLGAFVSC
jgi:hypothetical protein